jgi:iron uptake system component EfeO
MRPFRVSLLVLGILCCTIALAACGSAAPAKNNVTILVYDNYFSPAAVVVPPKQPVTVTFTNKGKNVHIVEIKGLTGESTLQPGQSKKFTITPQERSYKMYDEIYVSGGMEGTFTGGANAAQATTPTATPPVTLQRAIEEYRAYVIDQADQLVQNTQSFTDAVIAGDVAKAKSLFGPTRQYYESIEPIAESFGDLDPNIDARDGDVPDAQWRGFHRIEKTLWVDGTTQGQEDNARQLLTDVKHLRTLIDTLTLTTNDIIDGSVGLLEEASTSKITGEEDRYSHTDLFDLFANVEGSRAAFEVFKPFLTDKNPTLLADIETKFQNVETALLPYRSGDGFVAYDTLTDDQTKTIAQALDALGEPLSQVSGELPQN